MEKVFCYRNLNRKGVVWSAKSTKTGLVIERSEKIVVKDVQLKVSAAGRKRVLKQQRKNVHAGIVGVMLKRKPSGSWRRVEYNPYKYSSFVYSDTKQPVYSAKYATLGTDGLYIIE